MAPHSSILAWETPWTEEPGGLLSMGLQECWTRLSDSTTTTRLTFYVEVPGTGPHTEKALGESFYSGHLQEKPLSGVGVPGMLAQINPKSPDSERWSQRRGACGPA